VKRAPEGKTLYEVFAREEPEAMMAAKTFYVEVVANSEKVFRADGTSLSLMEAVAKAVATELPGTPVEVRRANGSPVPGRRYVGKKVERVEVEKVSAATKGEGR